MPLEGLKIRRAEAEDCSEICEMFESPAVYSGTMQVPYPSREYWRRRLSENTESVYTLVGIIDERIVGMVSVVTFPERPRRTWLKRVHLVLSLTPAMSHKRRRYENYH